MSEKQTVDDLTPEQRKALNEAATRTAHFYHAVSAFVAEYALEHKFENPRLVVVGLTMAIQALNVRFDIPPEFGIKSLSQARNLPSEMAGVPSKERAN